MSKALMLLAVMISLPAIAEDCYPVNASQGSVRYEVKQAGAPFRGAFRSFGGTVCLAGDRITRIDVWLDPASVDSGLPEIDAALKDKDFFTVAQYPRVSYASRSVEARGNGQLARGVLQIKGKQRDLDVPFSVQREGDRITASGSLTLQRLDYDVGTGEWSNTQWLSNEVKVEFRATLSAK